MNKEIYNKHLEKRLHIAKICETKPRDPMLVSFWWIINCFVGSYGTNLDIKTVGTVITNQLGEISGKHLKST